MLTRHKNIKAHCIQYLLKLLNFSLPRVCAVCANKSERNFDLCRKCQHELPRIQHGCRYCGKPLDKHAMLCGHCLKVKPYFDETIVPFHYQSPISNLITELKFKRKLYNSVVLGVLLAKHLKKQKNLEQPDLIMPVPLHKKRLRERGFNQALEIARLVSKHLQIPLDYQSCVRVRHTTAQASIHAKERKHNIKNAFEVIKPLRAKHIAIIDDVMTTGSTTNEIARVLKKAGVNKVSIWCCARTN